MTSADTAATAQSASIFRLLLILLLSITAFIQFTVVSRTSVQNPLRADAGEYFAYAYNLQHYGVYSLEHTWDAPPAVAPAPDKVRSPGYPLFLLMAGTPRPFEAYGLRVSFLQAAVGVASVWLLYLIGAMFLGRGLALVAALVTAISPHLAMMNTYLLTEPLFMFLLLASVFTLLQATQSSRRAWFIATGLLWGLCSLVRPTAEFFPPLLLLATLALPRLRPFRSNALIAFACFALVLAPWVIRNQSEAVSHPSSSLMVNTLAHGSYPGFMYEDRPDTFPSPYRFDPQLSEMTKDLPSVLAHIAQHFRKEPGRYFSWYLLGKPYFFLSLRDVQSVDILIYPVSQTPFYKDGPFKAMRSVTLALHWPLMLLGLLGAGLALLRPRWLGLEPASARVAGIVALVMVYAIAFHIVAAPFPRYAIPFRPLMYALALLPLRAAWLRWRST